MVENNDYGMKGLLKAIKRNDELVLGHDLNKMGLDFTSKRKYLHKNFSGPWTHNEEISVVDSSIDVPQEYKNVFMIQDKLRDFKMSYLSEEVLFYLFYNFPGDVNQLAAASELFKRGWRFHKTRKVWLITAVPTVPSDGGFSNDDLGESLCYIFDPLKWRKEPQTINLRSNQLEMSLDLQSVVLNDQKSMPLPMRQSSSMASTQDSPLQNNHRQSSSNIFNGQLHQQSDSSTSSESILKCVLNQLKRISQGMTISKSDLRALGHFLTENPEVFAKLESENGNNHFFNFIQHEPEVAGILLAFQMMYHPSAYYSNLDLLLSMEDISKTMFVVNKFAKVCESKSLPLPTDFLNKFVSLCISTCEFDPDQDMAAHRLVRMVCLFLDSMLGLRHFDHATMRAEIQNFATSYLALKEASQLYQKTLLH